MGKLIIDGKNVYEVDEECLKKRKVPPECKVEEAIRKQGAHKNKKENSGLS